MERLGLSRITISIVASSSYQDYIKVLVEKGNADINVGLGEATPFW